MFSSLIARKSVRALAALPVAVQTAAIQSFDPDQANMIAIMKVTARTAGTATVTLQGANSAAGPWVSLAAVKDLLPQQTVQSANGYAYIEFHRQAKPYIRFDVTPGGGFDGNISIDLATDRMFDGPANS